MDGPAAPPQRGADRVRVRMSRRPTSLQTRLLWAASLALFAFLGLAGFALDRAFYESSVNELRLRLRSHVFAYLKDTDISVSGKLIPPEFPPDSRFDRPQSGLYAVISGSGSVWESPSALGNKLPLGDALSPGQEFFGGPRETTAGPLFVYGLGVLLPWSERGEPREMAVSFYVAEHESTLAAQLEVFRRTLWAWLGALGVALLLVQLLLLRWTLKPLRRVATDLVKVERGEAERLPGSYPRELEGLTFSVNAFIDSERDQRTRYRNTLSDLAHSLKTPLAVMRNELEGGSDEHSLRAATAEQVRRMDEIVAYQLSRAATAGHKTFAQALEVDDLAEEIVRSLEKVHAAKGVLCEFDIDPAARFYGEQGDLMEVLGNLLENAFKWSRHRVMLTARRTGPANARRGGLELIVEDDGPGIPPDQVERLLQRGVRGDEQVQGHGIGLAILRDILRAYRGELSVTRSESLGGACFALRFAAVT